jgi:urea transport system permease protein
MLIGRWLRAHERIGIAVVLLVLLAILIPAMLLAVPSNSALHIPPYLVKLFGKYLTFAILAVAIDIIWGYCGILSLGHGAFFALGGYMMGMDLMHDIGQRGANPLLRFFVTYDGWGKLPLALLLVILVPGLLAFVFGFFAFRSRVNGVYLSIITQAMTYALLLAFFRDETGFGGNTGLNDFKTIAGFSVDANSTIAGLFALTALTLAATLVATQAIVSSKFGKVLISIRDAESRTRFVGYRVETYKVVVFTFSAVLAGIAGALFVPQVGIINPSEFAPQNSIEAVIWVAVGGRGTLVGAALGAVLVNLGKSYLTDAMPSAWLFALGLLFVLVTILMPKGLLGLIDQWRRTPKAQADAAPSADVAIDAGLPVKLPGE